MQQVTLVSLYGQKRGDLECLIKNCWQIIGRSRLARFFEPYHLNQIHGTLVGMEKLIGFDDPFNANTWQVSGNRVMMNYVEFLNVIKQRLPLTTRFGGFNENYQKFMSFGKTPYERSFQVQWSTSKLTLIGWPHNNNDFTSKQILWELRQAFESKCNIKHKYSNDNDLFMVLGELKGLESLADSELEALKRGSVSLEGQVREYLCRNPIDVQIAAEQVFITQYSRETLPLDSTKAYCIQNHVVNANFIQNLYD